MSPCQCRLVHSYTGNTTVDLYGNWGANGGNGVWDIAPTPLAIGGAAGEATSGPITWINRGDIRGATV